MIEETEYEYVKPQFSNEIFKSYPTRQELTVGELIEILKALPPELEITYDSGYGKLYAEEIHYNNKQVILNN
jgi:hypothetical protein